METKNFKEHIKKVLKTDERLWYFDEETKQQELNQTQLIDLAEKYDEKILSLLFNDEKTKAKFFVKIGSSATLTNQNYVFKTLDFQFFLEQNKIDNSYSQYKNRIGLTDGKRFIKDTKDVVLNFPFKDCVLEGGQSTEEGTDAYFEIAGQARNDNREARNNTKASHAELDSASPLDSASLHDSASPLDSASLHDSVSPSIYQQKQTKRKEIFFNEILAHDEIDRLFDEKALVNFKRVGEIAGQARNDNREARNDTKASHAELDSASPLDSVSLIDSASLKRDENGTIKENLIIKGNNLLALHSLKKQFAKKVKLIYIDPPYNTGGDANIFTYNNNFNHSTWLTFMKNRLEVARELLREDGFIAIAIDDIEQPYLRILGDEIFGRENFIGNCMCRIKPWGKRYKYIFFY